MVTTTINSSNSYGITDCCCGPHYLLTTGDGLQSTHKVVTQLIGHQQILDGY